MIWFLRNRTHPADLEQRLDALKSDAAALYGDAFDQVGALDEAIGGLAQQRHRAHRVHDLAGRLLESMG